MISFLAGLFLKNTYLIGCWKMTQRTNLTEKNYFLKKYIFGHKIKRFLLIKK